MILCRKIEKGKITNACQKILCHQKSHFLQYFWIYIDGSYYIILLLGIYIFEVELIHVI